jgi:hypothetical protein
MMWLCCTTPSQLFVTWNMQVGVDRVSGALSFYEQEHQQQQGELAGTGPVPMQPLETDTLLPRSPLSY